MQQSTALGAAGPTQYVAQECRDDRPTWHSVDCNPPLLKVLSLLAAAPKDEGVPPLESEDCGPLTCELAEEGVDLLLSPCVEPCLLSNIHHPGPRMYESQYLCRYEPATKDTLCKLRNACISGDIAGHRISHSELFTMTATSNCWKVYFGLLFNMPKMHTRCPPVV